MDAIVQTTKLEMILFASNSQWLPDRRPPVKMRLCGQTLHHHSHSHQPVALTLPAWTFQNTLMSQFALNVHRNVRYRLEVFILAAFQSNCRQIAKGRSGCSS